jgi:Zn-finger nucleic acid-binding protein
MLSPVAPVELRRADVDSFIVHACPDSKGVWVDERALVEWTLPLSVMRALRAEREVAPELVYRVRGGKAPPRRCPVCEASLRVVPWPRVEGSEQHIEVDVCVRHGAWFDAGELERVREWAEEEQAELEREALALRDAPFLYFLLGIVQKLEKSVFL